MNARPNYPAIKAHIITCLDFENYGLNPQTDDEKILTAYAIARAEMGHVERRHGTQQMLIDWLQGLPSACTLPFYNGEILEHAVTWNSLPANYTEKQADKILENYWRFMANTLHTMIEEARHHAIAHARPIPTYK